ncbi:MAG: alpha amylase C-terminal domain-containing protein [Victivallales bacterium]|nr:alpha amylase C-terminal domain-containing protein [Victivallales bacterium]
MLGELADNLPRPFGDEPGLASYQAVLESRVARALERGRAVQGRRRTLAAACDWHRHYGLHLTRQGWVFREWLPNATAVWLVGDFTAWRREEAFRLVRKGEEWVLRAPAEAIRPGQQYRLVVQWPGGEGERLPSAVTHVARSTPELWREDVCFNAVVEPQAGYRWRHRSPPPPTAPLIYEAHVGMAQEREGIGTFDEFRRNVLPRIARGGYNTVQLMGLQEHPYYASFGYHVSNFFAVTDLFGEPEDFRRLIDDAHGLGLRVIIDLVHSHAASNEVEGLSRMDGTPWLYFHDGPRGVHPAWGSRCFDYGKTQVLRFLLSNCRFWLEEYHLDGFRFDGITSMLFRNHGLGQGDWNYDCYFSDDFCDPDAIAYLMLANRLIHAIREDATTIAEDVSGFPGLAASSIVSAQSGAEAVAPSAEPEPSGAGVGFDYRLAMGVTDYWFRLADIPDESWSMGTLWHELTSRREDERVISYVECHDQALVGGKTFASTIMGEGIHFGMSVFNQSLAADRGIALHKMARLITFASAGHGYLNFMGNEFGHPDWIDFPTARNHWSFAYARRQWRLVDDPTLRFRFLDAFDRRLLALAVEQPRMFLRRPGLLCMDEGAKLVAFERGPLVFAFNFHPEQSLESVPIPAFPGAYRLLFNTDSEEFGGFARIAAGQTFFTSPVRHGDHLDHALHLYLPCRTAVVLCLNYCSEHS